jgi:DNA-binding NarL/FixJ family response regulator
MSHSVLVVEDDMNTRSYLVEALSADEGSYTVATAATLREGVLALTDRVPDVMLVDLGLPDGNGLDLIRGARELSTDVLTLVITVFGDEATVIGAIEAGAQGYLLKSEAPEDLRECVRQLLAGGAPISPGIASHLLRRFQSIESDHNAANGNAKLTTRERDVLELLVKGLPYKEVGDLLGVTRNTVTSHVRSIYRKLEVTSRGEAVFEALRQGIVQFPNR